MSDTERGRRPQDLPGGGELPVDEAGLRVRTVRVGDELWDAAAEWAAAEGSNMSVLIRQLLTHHMRRAKQREGGRH